MSHDVFICYNSNDKKIADMICGALESNKINCWIAPRDSSPGASYAGSIIDAINTTKILVLVYSASSMQSPFVIGEVERAFSKRVRIITFRLEDIPPSKDIELFISSRHWLDAFTPPIAKHINHLVETVLQILDIGTPQKEVATTNTQTKSASLKTSKLSKSKVATADDYYNKGKKYYETKNYERALQAFEEAIKIKPNFYNAWLYKGNAFSELKRFNEALAAYNQSIELNPEYYNAWNGKGNALSDLKHYGEALTAYNQAIKLNPDELDSWYNKGLVLQNLKQYDEALIAYNQAIKLNSVDPDSWYNKGLVLQDLKRYDESLSAYNQAIKLNPGDPDSWNAKGHVLNDLKRTSEAAVAFRTAKKLQKKT